MQQISSNPPEIRYYFPFEHRQYDSNLTPIELQAIKDQVFIYDAEIIYLKQIPFVSPHSIDIVFDEIERLSPEVNNVHGVIIDVTETMIPDSLSRRAINSRFSDICDKVGHVAFCTGKNVLFNTVIKFLMYQTNLESYSIHRHYQDAIAQVKQSLSEY